MPSRTESLPACSSGTPACSRRFHRSCVAVVVADEEPLTGVAKVSGPLAVVGERPAPTESLTPMFRNRLLHYLGVRRLTPMFCALALQEIGLRACESIPGPSQRCETHR
jgi:hypothetical protein